MSQFDMSMVAKLALLPGVVKASQAAANLIELWPLTDATQLDNDTKYGENLQVRMTQSLARIMTGQDVTIADAEFVYEGADEIPGRPQSIVDALLVANDAYDGLTGFPPDSDAIMQTVGDLEAGWDQEQCQVVQQILQAAVESLHTDETNHINSSDIQALAERLSASIVLAYELGQAVGASRDDARKVLPILLVVNEFNDRVGIPRCYISDLQLQDLLVACCQGQKQEAIVVFAEALAPLLEQEWEQHRVDVLWDPEEAQRKAKEDDERKSREALRAKFAHVPEDPNKPPVEL